MRLTEDQLRQRADADGVVALSLDELAGATAEVLPEDLAIEVVRARPRAGRNEPLFDGTLVRGETTPLVARLTIVCGEQVELRTLGTGRAAAVLADRLTTLAARAGGAVTWHRATECEDVTSPSEARIDEFHIDVAIDSSRLDIAAWAAFGVAEELLTDLERADEAAGDRLAAARVPRAVIEAALPPVGDLTLVVSDRRVPPSRRSRESVVTALEAARGAGSPLVIRPDEAPLLSIEDLQDDDRILIGDPSLVLVVAGGRLEGDWATDAVAEGDAVGLQGDAWEGLLSRLVQVRSALFADLVLDREPQGGPVLSVRFGTPVLAVALAELVQWRARVRAWIAAMVAEALG